MSPETERSVLYSCITDKMYENARFEILSQKMDENHDLTLTVRDELDGNRTKLYLCRYRSRLWYDMAKLNVYKKAKDLDWLIGCHIENDPLRPGIPNIRLLERLSATGRSFSE